MAARKLAPSLKQQRAKAQAISTPVLPCLLERSSLCQTFYATLPTLVMLSQVPLIQTLYTRYLPSHTHSRSQCVSTIIGFTQYGERESFLLDAVIPILGMFDCSSAVEDVGISAAVADVSAAVAGVTAGGW